MSPGLKLFLQRWLINTVAVLIASCIVPGVHYQDWHHLFVATFLLGILNTFVKPLMLVLSLPLVIFSLGLFMLVVNALLLMFVGWLMGPGFNVASFGQAFLAAFVIALVSFALNIITGTGSPKVQVHRRQPPDKPDDSGGPVIDV